MATHSSVLAWRNPGTREAGGLPSMGSHRVRHDWSNLAAAYASKVMLIILQGRLQQYVNHELPYVQLYLEKAEEPEFKLPTSVGSLKKQSVPEKHLLLLYWLHQSLWMCGSQQTLENSSRDEYTRPPYLPPKKSVCRSRNNS